MTFSNSNVAISAFLKNILIISRHNKLNTTLNSNVQPHSLTTVFSSTPSQPTFKRQNAKRQREKIAWRHFRRTSPRFSSIWSIFFVEVWSRTKAADWWGLEALWTTTPTGWTRAVDSEWAQSLHHLVVWIHDGDWRVDSWCGSSDGRPMEARAIGLARKRLFASAT